MYEAPGNEANTADAEAKVPLSFAVLQVWERGQITAHEALRAMYGILQGTVTTPFGAQSRETQRDAMARYDAELAVRRDGPELAYAPQGGAAFNGGPAGLN